MKSSSRIQLEKWLSSMKVRCNSVLDIGGSFKPVKERCCSFNVDDYIILEKRMSNDCKIKPDIIFDMNNKIHDNSFIYNKYLNRFNKVFMLEVSESMFNPMRAFKNVNRFLKMGGTFYVSTHFVYPVYGLTEEDYIRYTPRGIEKMLEIAGFEIVDHTLKLEERPLFLGGNGFADTIVHWFKKQNMDMSEDYDYHNATGSLVKCKKIKEYVKDNYKFNKEI